jgi:hypothetical protein
LPGKGNAVHRTRPGYIEQAYHSKGIKHIYARTEQAEHKYLRVLGLFKSFVLFRKLCLFSFLLIESLRDLYTGKVFGKEYIYVGDACFNFPVGFT